MSASIPIIIDVVEYGQAEFWALSSVWLRPSESFSWPRESTSDYPFTPSVLPTQCPLITGTQNQIFLQSFEGIFILVVFWLSETNCKAVKTYTFRVFDGKIRPLIALLSKAYRIPWCPPSGPEVWSVVPLEQIHKVCCLANGVQRDDPHSTTSAKASGGRVRESVLTGAPCQQVAPALVLVIARSTTACQKAKM